MKPIKITIANATAIHDALRAVNGRASTHAYTSLSEIQQVAAWGEKRLENLSIPKAQRGGAVFSAISGDQLPKAYKYRARGTWVEITRRSSAWYLTDADTADIYPGMRGTTRWLRLTQAQDAKAIEVLRREYTIAEPVAQPVAQPERIAAVLAHQEAYDAHCRRIAAVANASRTQEG